MTADRLAHTWPSPLGNPPGQTSSHSKPSCPHDNLANSHLGTRESSKRGLDDGLLVVDGGEDFVADGLSLKACWWSLRG